MILYLKFSIAHGGLSSGMAIKYMINENAVVECNPGFKLKHKSNNKIVCRLVRFMIVSRFGLMHMLVRLKLAYFGLFFGYLVITKR